MVIKRAPVRLGASSFSQTSHGLRGESALQSFFLGSVTHLRSGAEFENRKRPQAPVRGAFRGFPKAGETLSSPENFVTWSMPARSCLQGGQGSALELRSELVWSSSHTRTVMGLPEADVRYNNKTSPEKCFILAGLSGKAFAKRWCEG